MTFALDLKAFAQKAKDNADMVVKNIVVRVAGELDKRSPVGDAKYWKHPAPKGYTGGRFRGNWQLGVGIMPAGETGRIDKTGIATLGAIVAEIPAHSAGKVFYLSNNVPYAHRIENGWSRQAPAGLVSITAVMFQRIVNEAVAELPK
jgi:hypothetical protein